MCNFAVPIPGVPAIGFELPSPPSLPGITVSVPGIELNLSLPKIGAFIPPIFGLPDFLAIPFFAALALGIALKLSLPSLSAFLPPLFGLPSIPEIPAFTIPCPMDEQ